MKIDPIKNVSDKNPNINNPQKKLNSHTLSTVNKTRSMKIESGKISNLFGHTIVVLKKSSPKMSEMFSAYNGAKPQASNQTRNSIKKVD